MLIQVDVDSTLYDADKLFWKVAVNEFGVKWPKGATSWLSAEEMGTDLQTLKKIFRRAHSREYVLQNTPYPGAVETLKDIAETFDDVEIAYVSDRNEQQTAALRDWLEQEEFLFSGDEYVAATKDKREWMREERPDIVIDDRVRTLLLARFELDAYGVSLTHPHNINLRNEVNGIYLCNDWAEIREVLMTTVIPKIQTKVKV
jgi:hypothetical protein